MSPFFSLASHFGHDSFIDGSILGFEAVVQEVNDVQGFAVKEDGDVLYSGVAAFYGDSVFCPQWRWVSVCSGMLGFLSFILLYYTFRLFSS
jgi:hypothetical protein